MSATYNWAYRPGVANKYGIEISPSADDVRPPDACYVALYGNDDTGNGSRQKPFRTIVYANRIVSGSNIIIVGGGVYRESGLVLGNSIKLVGDGDVTFDVSFTGSTILGSTRNWVYNISFTGSGSSRIGNNGDTAATFTDCNFNGCAPVQTDGGDTVAGQNLINCILSNFFGELTIANNKLCKSCTFYKCGNLTIKNTAETSPPTSYNNIFSHCNISTNSATINTQYALFFKCNFKFPALGTGGGVYPTVPIGYNNYATIELLQAAFTSAYPSAVNPFSKCVIADPVFNNSAIGDFTLNFSSPAKNLSYFGTYLGARSIAYGLKIRALEANGDFDFSTAVNCTIADDSITLTNPNIDAVIETKVIENTLGRELKSIPNICFNADRNGQYIDSIADLSATTILAGDILTIPATYLVEYGGVNYNSAIYTAGQRFTTVTGQNIFTTTTGGVLREILEAPQRHTVEMRLSDVQPFTTEAFNHFEFGLPPKTNNANNSRNGEIIRGNGDPGYIRNSNNEFPINAKFIKLRFTIRANNLRP
ncbi:hypothetical protein [Mucilaginibacter phyllosphaerae]|uniref:DUF1565 domain-containing protein n=1 Tax=Mucilaginibacter phyllosphaerae TaxID=1812349 RepID=A0A4Y8ALA6_9SPHI|nr:hypothetical protein [Mucilaginibacter phyllosphaerae]MBB3967722.1 hypothetical protein [Mucilaginibacter phyllosphaerae]TEW69225.1 hypothetical protein E2R65_03390 [Mucilaginibacter phyllosphaerae]GGH03766.1 hypothetical protein GCM10007352_06570 [Mucilaginibacter phyllosphaerae]